MSWCPEIVFVVVVVLDTLSANVMVSRKSICCCCCFGHALSECYDLEIVFVVVVVLGTLSENAKVNVVVVDLLGTLSANVKVSRNSICFWHARGECYDPGIGNRLFPGKLINV
jgi:hypothetical protein